MSKQNTGYIKNPIPKKRRENAPKREEQNEYRKRVRRSEVPEDEEVYESEVEEKDAYGEGVYEEEEKETASQEGYDSGNNYQETDETLSIEEYEDLERKRFKKNRKTNGPMFVIMWFFVLTFLGMIAYNIYFMVQDAAGIRSDSRNPRRNDLAKVIVRGEILTADGKVVARTDVDSEGNETRVYPYDDVYCHVIGYNSYEYSSSGVENTANYDLLTSDIHILKQVMHELKGEKNPGNSVRTTIDSRLQKAAYDALGDNTGAAVVIEPSTGKILAMVSKPGFDPNEIEEVYYDLIDQSEEAFFLNRATQGLYAPGSTFKVITALEFIREHPNSINTYTYDCESQDIFRGVAISCHDDTAHGEENLTDSLAYSCNTSFANIGMRLDQARWGELCNSLFFNQNLPYTDGVSANSFFEITADTQQTKVPQTAIGQGNTAITPLHNAMIAATIANGGVLMKPYLIQSVENDDGAVVRTYSSSDSYQLMSATETKGLIEMMRAVVDHGTAERYFEDVSYEVAGKTGTAEYDDEGHSNSWFIGFNSPDHPEIVVSVIIEKYDDADRSATYAARQIFDVYEDLN